MPIPKDNTNVKLVNPFEFSKAQKEGSGIPYSELVKAYMDLYPERSKVFGSKSSLGQALELMEHLNPDANDAQLENKLAAKALSNIHEINSDYSDRPLALPASADTTLDDAKINGKTIAYNPYDFRAVLRNTANELSYRIGQLKSMSKPEVTLQKLKEKSGKDYITDKDYLEGRDPYAAAPDYNITSELEKKPIEKHRYDVARDSSIFNFKDNIISPEDSVKAVERAKAKKEYQEGSHPIYTGLKFTPLSPIAVAAENGEPWTRGVAGAIPSVAGTIGGVIASPFITPVGGAAIAGASNALGDEIARGERPDELTGSETAKSYLIPTAIGGAMGGGLGAIGNKASKYLRNKKLKVYEDKAKAAEDAYEHANQYLYKGQPYDYTKSGKTTEDLAAEAATANVMSKAKQGKFNEIDVDDIDKVILNPQRYEELSNALSNTREAYDNEELRLNLLKALNSNQNFINRINQVIPEMGGEDITKVTIKGNDPMVKLARGEARQGLNNNEDLDNLINMMLDPRETHYEPLAAKDIAANKVLYSEANLPETADQAIFHRYGFDELGKGPITGTPDNMFSANRSWRKGKGLLIKDIKDMASDVPEESKQKLINPFIHQYINDDAAGGIAFGRGVQAQAQSYVKEAYDLLKDGKLDKDKLNNLAKEYMQWRLPLNHRPADEKNILREFVANILIQENKPGAGYSYLDPSAISTAEINNRGKNIIKAMQHPEYNPELHTKEPLGRPSFEWLRRNFNSDDVTGEDTFEAIRYLLDKNGINLRPDGLPGSNDAVYGWAGGFERPSAEAYGAFEGRKGRNKFRYTIDPNSLKS